MGITALFRDRPRWTQLVSALPHLVQVAGSAFQAVYSSEATTTLCSRAVALTRAQNGQGPAHLLGLPIGHLSILQNKGREALRARMACLLSQVAVREGVPAASCSQRACPIGPFE
eukprot:734944-Amphidinium_carterae.1